MCINPALSFFSPGTSSSDFPRIWEFGVGWGGVQRGRCVTQLLPGALVGDRGQNVLSQSSSSLHPPHPSLGQLTQAPSLSIPRSCLYREPLSHSLAGFSTLPNIPPLLVFSALISPVPVAPTPPVFLSPCLPVSGLHFLCSRSGLNLGFPPIWNCFSIALQVWKLS